MDGRSQETQNEGVWRSLALHAIGQADAGTVHTSMSMLLFEAMLREHRPGRRRATYIYLVGNVA
jgi:hypothetical protein